MQTLLRDLLLLVLIITSCLQFIRISKMKSHIGKLQKIKDALYEIAYEIVHTEDEEQLYSLFLNTSINLISNASKGSILLLGEDGKFHFKTLVGYSEVLKNICFSKDEIFINNIKSKESVIIKNPSKFDKKTLGEDKKQHLESNNALDMICTISSPIYIDDELIGLINIDSTNSNRVFTEEDRTFMDYIKRDLELVIKNNYIQNKLKTIANHDELTGLINRRYFRYLFEKEVDYMKESKNALCIISIDINDFKIINDTYGHSKGDLALIEFSKVIKSEVGQDICARISGDEFVILLRNCSIEQSQEKINTIQNEIRKIKFGDLSLDFSYGIYCIDPEECVTIDEILARADREMYKNKRIFHCSI